MGAHPDLGMEEMSIKLGFMKILALAFAGSTALVATPSFAGSVPAIAFANSVVLTSEAMIERTEVDANGKESQTLKQPKDVIVVPGDRVIFTLRYVNKGAEPATGFRATNPMPGPVQFVSVAEDWAEVSVNGGANWGKLANLKVAAKASEGSVATLRPATAEDVTHVRWVFTAPIPPGAEGSVSFRGLIK